jgi:hypothetical protein
MMQRGLSASYVSKRGRLGSQLRLERLSRPTNYRVNRCQEGLTPSNSSIQTRFASNEIAQEKEERLKLERRQKGVERQLLLEKAGSLTKSIYRICLRSVNVIRWGNELDEKEFQRREEELANPTGVFSMAPPPNREDELRSRAEYYQSYAKESFLQESDCLDNDALQGKDIDRFLYYLRKGNKDRKWLLADMMFPDPFKNTMDQDKIKDFEDFARRHVGDDAKVKHVDHSSADAFFDDVSEDPEWFQKKFPHLR